MYFEKRQGRAQKNALATGDFFAQNTCFLAISLYNINMTFEQALEKIGVNTAEVLARFSGNEMLMKKFILKFPEDKSFPDTKAALAASDKKAVELSAHTLKGVSGNLGFTALYEASAALVNAVRAGEDDKIEPLGKKVIELGDSIVSVLGEVE